MSIIFNQICPNKEMLPIHTHTHTHTHTQENVCAFVCTFYFKTNTILLKTKNISFRTKMTVLTQANKDSA